MKISEEFPSQYLKASDLGGRDIRVTMGRVEREKIGTDNKLVLYFKGKDKGLVLNKTNARHHRRCLRRRHRGLVRSAADPVFRQDGLPGQGG
jgi:hypothetical protein